MCLLPIFFVQKGVLSHLRLLGGMVKGSALITVVGEPSANSGLVLPRSSNGHRVLEYTPIRSLGYI